jgi:hypothetical protein
MIVDMFGTEWSFRSAEILFGDSVLDLGANALNSLSFFDFIYMGF